VVTTLALYRFTALPLVALALAQETDPMAAHDRLDAAMFWVGAMFAFTPILVAIGVGSVIWWQRRKRSEAGEDPQ
jgi:hypothetical protein